MPVKGLPSREQQEQPQQPSRFFDVFLAENKSAKATAKTKWTLAILGKKVHPSRERALPTQAQNSRPLVLGIQKRMTKLLHTTIDFFHDEVADLAPVLSRLHVADVTCTDEGKILLFLCLSSILHDFAEVITDCKGKTTRTSA